MNPLWGDMPRYLGHRDANWNPMSFDFDKDLALTFKNASFIESSDPNLAKFKARGGKLLLWHGWADPGPSPENTIDYYSQVATPSEATQEDWMRLFLLPGRGALRRRSGTRSGGLPRCDGALARGRRRAVAASSRHVTPDAATSLR